MPGLIGYYVHHQGEGHRQRAIAIARHAPDRFVLLGTGLERRAENLPSLDLDDDRPVGDTRMHPLAAEDCLHYAPVHHAGIQHRVAALANWISHHRPRLLVIDVSVEIAMLARLAAVPTVYIRLAGCRTDAAHRQAFHAARTLLAPFHSDLDDPATPSWVREKTCYVPGLTRAVRSPSVDEKCILVVSGAGGGSWDAAALAAAAAALPQFNWRVIGQRAPPTVVPANLSYLGWVDDADRQIAAAGVVIGHAGDGVVTAVLAAGRPFVCQPQPRPYQEQVSKARQLAAMGAAVVIEQTPAADEWDSIIARALSLKSGNIARLHAQNAARKAVDILLTAADRLP